MASTDLVVEPTALRAAQVAAARIGALLRSAITARGTASVAFSGGHTPVLMLEALAEQSLPWQHVHVFQVDERVAPNGDAERNSTALRGTLLDRVATNAHLMDVTAAHLGDAAHRYADELRPHEPLDVVHLGMGDDGHTASWPPGDAVIDERDHAVAIVGPYRGMVRMTITPPVVHRASAVLLLVTGADKAPVLARLMSGDRSVVAAHVLGARTVVVADQSAAGTPA